MGHWKGKLNDDEMTDAMPALNSPGTRAVADIEAELERVAQLRSGLTANVQPGQYASALEAHLSSVSSALQLELEQALQEPGATGTRQRASPPCRPAARRPLVLGQLLLTVWPAVAWTPVRVAAPKSAPPDPESAGQPEGSAPHSRRVRPRLRHRPILIARACMRGGIEARMAGPGFLAACHPHRRGACSLQSTTLRSGWLRSLYNLFGFGKQQEAASILAAVRAAKPVARADRAGPRRWATRGSIEHGDLAL